MACPFFVPTERADDLALPHLARLPLGTAWRGACGVPEHKREVLGNKDLEICNLGYAKSCPRLPQTRTCDAVRFGVVKESAINISVQVVFETEHRPAGLELIEYDRMLRRWRAMHPDLRVQRQAECFLQAYLERKSYGWPADRLASDEAKAFTTEATESRGETAEPQ